MLIIMSGEGSKGTGHYVAEYQRPKHPVELVLEIVC